MRDYTPKIRDQAVDLLNPGEPVIRSVVGNAEGTALASMNRGISADAALLGSLRRSAPREGLAARIPKRNAYVTLTDQRLVLLGVNKLGRVNSVLAEFAFDEIAAARSEPAGFKKHQLTLEFVDGTAFRYLIIQNQQPDDLAEELTRRAG